MSLPSVVVGSSQVMSIMYHSPPSWRAFHMWLPPPAVPVTQTFSTPAASSSSRADSA